MVWKKTVNLKGNEWWEKLDPTKKRTTKISSNFITLQEQSDYIKKAFPNSNWEVRAAKRINPETSFGKSKNFKTKSSAMKFVKSYMKKYN